MAALGAGPSHFLPASMIPAPRRPLGRGNKMTKFAPRAILFIVINSSYTADRIGIIRTILISRLKSNGLVLIHTVSLVACKDAQLHPLHCVLSFLQPALIRNGFKNVKCYHFKYILVTAKISNANKLQ